MGYQFGLRQGPSKRSSHGPEPRKYLIPVHTGPDLRVRPDDGGALVEPIAHCTKRPIDGHRQHAPPHKNICLVIGMIGGQSSDDSAHTRSSTSRLTLYHPERTVGRPMANHSSRRCGGRATDAACNHGAVRRRARRMRLAMLWI